MLQLIPYAFGNYADRDPTLKNHLKFTRRVRPQDSLNLEILKFTKSTYLKKLFSMIAFLERSLNLSLFRMASR